MKPPTRDPRGAGGGRGSRRDAAANGRGEPRYIPMQHLELGGLRRSVIVGLVIAILIPLGVAGWALYQLGRSSSPTHTVAGGGGSGATAGGKAASGSGSAAVAHSNNPIMKAVEGVNVSDTAKGQLPPSKCKVMDPSMVTCTSPIPAVDTVTFQTFPSMKALYAAYVKQVSQLAQGPFRANFSNCTETLTNGERSWNHDYHHPITYPLSDFTSGKITDDQAAGRVYCTFANSMLHMVWTQDDGNLMGELSGAPHTDAYVWWREVHHSVVLPGFTGMKSMQGMGSTKSTKSMPSTKSTKSMPSTKSTKSMPSTKSTKSMPSTTSTKSMDSSKSMPGMKNK